MVAIEAGAEDVQVSDGSMDITTEPQRLDQVRKALEGSGAEIVSVEDLMQPKSTVALEGKEALQNLRLLDKLENLDDVQKAFSNADIPDEIMEQYEG